MSDDPNWDYIDEQVRADYMTAVAQRANERILELEAELYRLRQASHIWAFEDAPEQYQQLSQHGGDEDWIAFVPHSLLDAYMPWLESGGSGSIGCCDVATYDVNGGRVYIGAHA